MSDGQEKSDDLIAELAKLMASGAEPTEAEGKPAPKLVSEGKDAAPPPRPVRIPGMDQSPASHEAVEPSVNTGDAGDDGDVSAPEPNPVSQPNPAAAAPRPAVRIPGMDHPAPSSGLPSRETSSSPSSDAPSEPAAPAQPPKSSFDFGRAPSVTPLSAEPVANWRAREVPKPAPRPVGTMVPGAPASSPPPAPNPPVDSPVVPEQAQDGSSDGEAHEGPAPVVSEAEDTAVPEAPDEAIVSNRPQPADDSFDFDFGFGASDGPVQDDAAPADRTEPDVEEDDPIADLIAAELDAAEAQPKPEPRAERVEPTPIVPPSSVIPSSPKVAPEPRVSAEPPKPAPVPSSPSPVLRQSRLDEDDEEPVFPPSKRPTRVERDPMAEIENLIGEAVRVELEPSERPMRAEQQSTSAAPVVPPLTTGFAPRRAAIKDSDPSVSSAEAAILAAAAAGGAEVGRTKRDAGKSAKPYRRTKAKVEKPVRGSRQVIGMAVAGTLLLASGFGLYWVLSMGAGPASDTEAPVLTADTTPAKADPPPEAESEATNSVVFNELDGVESNDEEQLVSRDDSVDTSVADVAQPVGDVATVDTELANRKVRTVTVRPDGTIVSGDESMAGSEPLPVDRPTVPELPGADVQPSELLASLPGTDVDTTSSPAEVQVPAATETPAADQVASLIEPTDPTTINPDIVAPVPMPRPANRAALNSSSTATTTPAVSTPSLSIDTPATANGPYVQLASQRSESEAQSSLRTLQSRLGGVLGGAQLQVRQVNLGSKGIWYRVVLPTGSFQQATQACATIKANGSDCVPING